LGIVAGTHPVRLKGLLPALIVLLLALAAAGLSWLLVKRDVAMSERAQFESEASEVRDGVADAMRTYETVLRAGVGMFKAQSNLSAAQWRTIVASLELETSFPGFQGLGYSAVVHKDQIEALEAAQRRQGNSTFTVHPRGAQEYYTVIMFLEPDDWRNRRALGFDMFSEPTRRAAMERARDTGAAALSGKVELVQETHDDVQAGTLMYLPIYSGETNPTTLEGRRARLTGFMYGAFRMTDLLRSVLQVQTPAQLSAFSITIYDGTAGDSSARLFASTPREQASGSSPFKVRYPLEIAGAAWIIDIAASYPISTSIDRHKPLMVLIAGLIIACLVAGITASLALSRERLESAQRVLAADVKERQLAQESAELANNELIHRVKNTLAVVSAIASQTVRYSSNLEEFGRAFRERLNSLARVQDLLRPNSSSVLDLTGLVREVLRPYASSGGHGLVIDGPGAPVARNDVVLLSLTLNELATNATKYGAWSVPDGKVTVSWHSEAVTPKAAKDGLETEEHSEEKQRDELVILWAEEGGPPVSAPSKKGFGSAVIQFAVERGLHGKMEADYAHQGIRYTIRLPTKSRGDGADAGQQYEMAE